MEHNELTRRLLMAEQEIEKLHDRCHALQWSLAWLMDHLCSDQALQSLNELADELSASPNLGQCVTEIESLIESVGQRRALRAEPPQRPQSFSEWVAGQK